MQLVASSVLEQFGRLRPMKATSGELPVPDEGWAYEVKWDGMRILAFVADGVAKLHTSNLIDATNRFPELAGLVGALEGHEAILDGEVVAFDDNDQPSFGRLQQRMHISNAVEARRLSADVPVTFVVFDLVHLDGHDMISLEYRDRRRLLGDLLENGGGWLVPNHREGDGAALLEAAGQQGLEGVVAKRLDSRYEPGKRSPNWRKVKVRRRQELVIGGWLPGEGNRSGQLGSVLVGYYDADGQLQYAGRVGSGFNQRELARIAPLLDDLAVDEPPFVGTPPAAVRKVAHWVEPRLVAEVAFACGRPTACCATRRTSGCGWTRTRPTRARALTSHGGDRDRGDPPSGARRG